MGQLRRMFEYLLLYQIVRSRASPLTKNLEDDMIEQ